MPSPRIILDLCGGTGSWSAPYRKAGYDVRVITLPMDVRDYQPPLRVWGILMAPPCQHFAVSGSQYWKAKGSRPIADGLSIVHACLRIKRQTRPQWWALENPVGRLPRYIGSWVYTFQPWEFGDAYFKRTCMWGEHCRPTRTVTVAPLRTPQTEWVHHCPPGPNRAALRSVTPKGFARAFFKANP